MKRFEFKTIVVKHEDAFHPHVIEKQLNNLGRSGWEVVASSDRTEKGVVSPRFQFIIILQREVQSKKTEGVRQHKN